MLVGVRSNRASRYGKCSALPTSPHLRGRPRTIVQRRDTLTPHLVQDIAPVPLSPDSTVESIHLPLSDCRRHPTSPKRSRYEHIARLQRSLEDIGCSRQHDDGGVRPQLSHFDRTLLAVIWGITSSTIYDIKRMDGSQFQPFSTAGWGENRISEAFEDCLFRIPANLDYRRYRERSCFVAPMERRLCVGGSPTSVSTSLIRGTVQNRSHSTRFLATKVTENGQERYASRCELRSENGYVHLEAPETQSSE